MNRKLLPALTIVLTTLLLPALAEARCYAFRDKDFKVCVEGNNGSARSQATSVCEDVSDGDCRISGDSGECRRSSSTRCYDASGNEQSHIDPD